MSFATFLKRTAQMALGYIVGFLLLIAGAFAFAESATLGGILFVLGVVVILYGVYSERNLKR